MKIDKGKPAVKKSATGNAKGSKGSNTSSQAGADFAAELARLQGGGNASVDATPSDGADSLLAPTAPTESADMASILALQEVGPVGKVNEVDAVGDALEGKRRARVRASALIKSLEEIHMAILLGAIPLDQLVELAQMAMTTREEIQDKALLELLDDIELRAMIEIAKYAPELLDEPAQSSESETSTMPLDAFNTPNSRKTAPDKS